MIHATNSPIRGVREVYAEPATGSVDANSA